MTNRYLASAVLFLITGGSALAAYGCTSINTAPITITASGHYCLASNISATTNAITINASDVVLDCGGHVINGTGVITSSTAIGVRASERNNITVKNCTIKGFAEGIVITGFGNSVTDNIVTGSLVRGIKMTGENNLIRDNWITDIGGTTLTSSAYSVTAGILSTGTTDIRSNIVSGIEARAQSGRGAYGIYSGANDAGTMDSNTVRNLIADGSGLSMAITAYNSTNAVMINNQASNPPSTYGYAFYCSGSGSISKGNIAQGYAYGQTSACADGGGNVLP